MDFKEKIRRDLYNAGVDVSLNNTIDDLFTKKYLQINEPIRNDLIEIPKRLSFLNFENLTEEDQDMFAGNFFVNVSSGEKATNVVRVYYDSPTDSMINEGTIFRTDDELEFLTIKDYSIQGSEMANYTEGMYYYHEITVEAKEKSEDYNVGPDTIVNCANTVIENRAVKISNPYSFSNGAGMESPEKTYNRVKDSISARNLANDPSINSVIKNNFVNSVIDVFPVRTGHELMRRDIKIINNTEYRVGNMHDIWVETSDLAEFEIDITKKENPIVNLGFSIGDLGVEMFEPGHDYIARTNEDKAVDMIVIKVLEVSALSSDGIVSETISGVDFIQSLFEENSVRQKSYLDFTGTTYENVVSDLRIKVLASPSLSQIQKFVNDPKNRMPVGDPLIRHFELLPLYGIIYYRGDIEAIELQEKLNEFIKYYHYNTTRAADEYARFGEPVRRIFEVSDLISKLYEDVDKVKLPISLEIDMPYIEVDPFEIVSDYDTYIDLPYFKILYDSEVVTDGITVYNRNEDYQMDYEAGRVVILSGGNMTNGVAYNISFKAQSPNGIGSSVEFVPVEDEHKILPYQTLVPKVSVAIEEGV